MKQRFLLLLLLAGLCSAAAQESVRPSAHNITRTLQAAIDSASARYARTGERQTLFFAPGVYRTGTLYLKSGVTLHLKEGAVLQGSTNPFDYVQDRTVGWTALLFAVGQHDIGITGRGTIDGQGWAVACQTIDNIHKGLMKDPLKYDRPEANHRPELIHFLRCENVLMQGVMLKDPASWCQQYELCSHLTLDGIRVEAKCFWNNDGLDVVDCREVVVRNCFIDASDDAYCFKSHHPEGVSENVLVENCVGRSSANGIKFGTVTRGTFRHFRFYNNEIRNTYRSGVTIASVDGASISDIVVDGLRCVNTGNPFFLRFSPRGRGSVSPEVRDIVLRNIQADVPAGKPDAGEPFEGPVEDQPRNVSPASIVGCPGMRIRNVLLENIEIRFPGGGDTAKAFRAATPAALAALPEWERRYPEFSMWKELPAWGLFVRHADSVTLRNVVLRADSHDYRPAIVADDVAGLSFEGVTVGQRPQDGGSAIIANGCRQVRGNARFADGKACRVRQQRGCEAAASATAGTTSDIILAQDNKSPCTEGATLYKATLFGCRCDGQTMNTGSLQAALNHIAAHGGGTLVFEVGRYVTGSVTVPPHVDIQLNEGAVLKGSDNIYDYPPAQNGRRALLLTQEGAAPRVCGLGSIEVPANIGADIAAPL